MAKNNGGNVQVIDLADGRQVCLSYGVIVAAFIPKTYDCLTHTKAMGEASKPVPRGYLKTSRRYSVTASKHANAFAGKDAKEVDHETLQALCLPIVGRRT